MSKVVVGLSGGVDSAAAAIMLKQQGHDVSGATLLVDDCVNAHHDAEKVAQVLDIPFSIIDAREQFKKYVVDYFVSEYIKGRTPNPCILCNTYIKFGMFLDAATKIGADYVATGHYANVTQEGGRYLLKRGRDARKDQTYVLYNLTQAQLARIKFPLLGTAKEQTRELVRHFDLNFVADKPESQEICFVPDNDYAAFIQKYAGIAPQAGDFVDKDGKVLGRHKGIIHYTIGQRKGLGGGFDKPLFVTKIDAHSNTVQLGESSELFSDTLLATDVNFMPFDKLAAPVRVSAKIRYCAKEAMCTITPHGEGVEVKFDQPQRAITPGQAVVFYDNDTVVGGGTISC